MTLVDQLRRPAREQPLLLGGSLLAAVVAVIAVLVLSSAGASRPHAVRAATAATPSPPGAVIGTRPAPALSAAQVADARHTARRFLASYLPVLYGRRSVRTVRDASPHVRTELRDAARSPRAPRKRHPRIIHLTARAQGTSAVVTVAMIADGVARPYQIALQLTEHERRWQVTQISNY